MLQDGRFKDVQGVAAKSDAAAMTSIGAPAASSPAAISANAAALAYSENALRVQMRRASSRSGATICCRPCTSLVPPVPPVKTTIIGIRECRR